MNDPNSTKPRTFAELKEIDQREERLKKRIAALKVERDHLRKYVDACEYLRRDEGDLVTLVCNNPDFNGLPENYVQCNGEWTGWATLDFPGDTILEALGYAVLAKRKAERGSL